MGKRSSMTSVITGDIINSRKLKNAVWLKKLKRTLAEEGSSPRTWQIYRGDSFQVEVKDPAMVFLTVLRIKATLKGIKNLDVRMAIGIGKREFTAFNITESNGEAFIHSGEKLESLKKEKQTLAIESPWPELDKEMNVCFQLALIAMDNWSPSSAELIRILVDKPEIRQKVLARKLKISQSSVSERQKRSNFTAIMDLENLFREKINHLIA
ncbi:MAG: SatD family protein [Cyclobacteriaceae bacterium]